MILKGPKFYTIKGAFDDLVLWVGTPEKQFPDPPARYENEFEVNDSTEEEKAYWMDSMIAIDKRLRNEFQGVSLKDFEKWKTKKQ